VFESVDHETERVIHCLLGCADAWTAVCLSICMTIYLSGQETICLVIRPSGCLSSDQHINYRLIYQTSSRGDDKARQDKCKDETRICFELFIIIRLYLANRQNKLPLKTILLSSSLRADIRTD